MTGAISGAFRAGKAAIFSAIRPGGRSKQNRDRVCGRYSQAGIREDPGWGSPLYDAATGDAVWYGPWRGRWRAWDIGHHQERLPAIIWTLCPDFPSASELGMGVNQLQTAVTYDALLAQDRGRRILRPDLVTPDPSEPAK